MVVVVVSCLCLWLFVVCPTVGQVFTSDGRVQCYAAPEGRARCARARAEGRNGVWNISKNSMRMIF